MSTFSVGLTTIQEICLNEQVKEKSGTTQKLILKKDPLNDK